MAQHIASLTKTRTFRAAVRVVAPIAACTLVAFTGFATAGGMSPARTNAAAADVTSTFAVTDDTYVSLQNATTAHGSLDYIRLDASPTRVGYVRFSVAGISGSVVRAQLRVYARQANAAGFDVHSVSSSWSESSLTYANAPAPDAAMIASSGAVAAGTWVSVDVSSAVHGDGALAFALTTKSSSSFQLASKEAAGALGATLVVTASTASGTTSTAATTTAPPPTTTAPPPTTTAPPPSPQPLSFPIRAAFYYPWYPETWTIAGKYPHATPTLGYYSSSDAAVVDNHIRALDYGGVRVAIASWWGPSTHSESTRIPLLLNRTAALGSPLKWTLYYEPEGQSNPTVSQISSDLAYISANYASHSSYAKLNGKPVLFVYNANDTTCDVANRWAQAAAGNWYIVLKVFSGYRTCATQPSSWHQYAPAVAAESQSGYSYSISPGFWRADEATPRLTRDPTRWTQNVSDMTASGAPWQLITTFNEWGEGTAVESATDWASSSGMGVYLDALHGGTPPPPPPPTTSGCAGSAPPVGGYKHVVWIWMENKSYSQIIGSSSAPYENELANGCGLATAYHAVTHPSLPNYIAATSGDTQGITDDNPPSSHPLSVPSLFSQVKAAGLTWRSYQESSPGNCTLTSSGLYAVKHDPATYYVPIRTDCAVWDIPMGTTSAGNFLNDLNAGTLPAFSFVTPNMCNDTHDCSIATGDAWLKAWFGKILASPAYLNGDTVIFLTWDEDDFTSVNLIPMIVVGPSVVRGTRVSTTWNHYGLLKTTELLLGIPTFLGHAGDPGVPDMRAPFHLAP